MTSLNLANNRGVGLALAEELLEMLQINTTLRSLDLRGNALSEETQQLLLGEREREGRPQALKIRL